MEEKFGEELKSLIKLLLIAISSLCYCYLIPSGISNGVPRLLSLLPIITIFFILPLLLSSIHLALPAFFFLAFLSNFKLLLFSFNHPPLASKPPLTFLVFICVALLPINPKQPNYYKKKILARVPSHKLIRLAIKVVILAVTVNVYQYKEKIHRNVIPVLRISFMYLSFEFCYAIYAFLVKLLLGFNFEIEPHFNEPYMATSLQDFWGRRWNLMASSILRATVYTPVRAISTPTLGRVRGQMVAIFVTFVVSGVMHEVMYLYLLRVWPTWEVSWFFVIHGVFTAGELAVRKAFNGRFQLHKSVSWTLTMGFLVFTADWLLFPQLLRNRVDEKIVKECFDFIKVFTSK